MRLNLVPATATRNRHAAYATVDTPFGQALAAVTEGQLCWLNYPQSGDGVAALQSYWKGTLTLSPDSVAPVVQALFAGKDVTLLLAGTPFQHSIWQALTQIAPGETLSYGALAARIGRPGAARAVGGAAGANPVIYFIPCHRVLASNGSLHGFGCGLAMKEKLLASEGFKEAA